MKNRSPIFLNCYSRGGSNILWNIFLSHLGACSPILETIEIFRLDSKGITLAGLKAAWFSRQWRLFDQWKLEERRTVPLPARRFIDETLYSWKLKTLTDKEMRFKAEDELYTRSEVEGARLVTKNNNGLAFLTDIWLEMYPQATFIAMVRNPLALYESHKRRGITYSVEAFAQFYRKIAERMLADADRLSCYHIIRFEDLLAQPIQVTRQLYKWADLDFDKVKKWRFKAKPHLHANGRRTADFMPGQHHWFAPEAICEFLEPSVNEFQIGRLQTREKEELLKLTKASLARLGY